jgi:DNA invertase Pin-like site-specific DNA recombinase
LISKAAIYARVSCSDEPIQSQVSDLRELAQRRGLETTVYEDRGTSTKGKHSGLDALIGGARRGRFEVVLVESFDRLGLSTKRFIQLMGELDELGVQFISCQENLDTSVPMGRMFLTHISSIVKLEAALNREKIRSGLRRRKLEGLPLGRVPLDIDRNALVHDRLSGMSLTQVAKRYGVSRASVVRFVRLAQNNSGATLGKLSLAAQREVPAAACVA